MQPNHQPESERPADGVERTAAFGPFELNLKTGELQKSGVKIRLQNKPYQILRALIEHPGRVVTREELRACLWPKDTFVDFESGLNTAANRLRLALSDSAEHPKYVETLPRLGYRFIEAVRLVEPGYASQHTIQTRKPGPLNIETGHPLSLISHTRARTSAPHSPDLSGEILADRTSPPSRLLSKTTASFALVLGGLGLLVLLGLCAIIFVHRRNNPVFHELTFRQGIVDNARFTPSGEVVYSAAWDDTGRHLYRMDVVNPESRQLDFGRASLVAVSKTSQIAFLRRSKSPDDTLPELDEAALNGGAPHPLQRDVLYADSGPDGTLCVIRRNLQGLVVEYPAGKAIYQSTLWLDKPRISPDGSSIAVAEHPLRNDDAGSVLLITRDGKASHLTSSWDSIQGVAWRGNGKEIWFAAARHGIDRELYAVNLRGALRRIAAMPAVLQLFDIAPSGRVLIGRSVPRLSLFVGDLKSMETKDISWLDFSHLCALSANGNEILFDEGGEGGGPNYTVYLHRRDRGTTEKIAYGRGLDLSANGASVLVGDHDPSSKITLISAEDGKSKVISAPGYVYQSAHFLGCTRDLAVQLTKQGAPEELYLQNMDTGFIRRILNSAGLGNVVPSPDGRSVASFVSSRESFLLDLESGKRLSIQRLDPFIPAGWTTDNHLILATVNKQRLRLEKYDPTAKQSQVLVDLPTTAQPGPAELLHIMVSEDLKSFAFSKSDETVNLFAVDGWS